jgi:hypothetical protein
MCLDLVASYQYLDEFEPIFDRSRKFIDLSLNERREKHTKNASFNPPLSAIFSSYVCCPLN